MKEFMMMNNLGDLPLLLFMSIFLTLQKVVTTAKHKKHEKKVGLYDQRCKEPRC